MQRLRIEDGLLYLDNIVLAEINYVFDNLYQVIDAANFALEIVENLNYSKDSDEYKDRNTMLSFAGWHK